MNFRVKGSQKLEPYKPTATDRQTYTQTMLQNTFNTLEITPAVSWWQSFYGVASANLAGDIYLVADNGCRLPLSA